MGAAQAPDRGSFLGFRSCALLQEGKRTERAVRVFSRSSRVGQIRPLQVSSRGESPRFPAPPSAQNSVLFSVGRCLKRPSSTGLEGCRVFPGGFAVLHAEQCSGPSVAVTDR